MDIDDIKKVIHGNVKYNGKWIPIERKLEIYNMRINNIKAGFVEHHGKWVSIDDKIAMVKLEATKGLNSLKREPLELPTKTQTIKMKPMGE